MMKRGNISVKVCDICQVDTLVFLSFCPHAEAMGLKIKLDVSNMAFKSQGVVFYFPLNAGFCFYFQGKGEMSTYWLTDVHRSPFESCGINSSVSTFSSSSFGMVCDMLQDGGSWMQAPGMEHSTKSLSASDLRNLAQSSVKTTTPISMSVSGDRPPDFNTFRNFIGRRKTEICIDEMTEKEKSERSLESQA